MRSLLTTQLVSIAILLTADVVCGQDLPGPVVAVVEAEGDGAAARAQAVRAALREALGVEVVELGDPRAGVEAPLLVITLRRDRIALLARPAGGAVHREVLESREVPDPAWVASRGATLLRESRRSGLTARGLMTWPAVLSASLPVGHEELLPWPSNTARLRPRPRRRSTEGAEGLGTPRPGLGVSTTLGTPRPGAQSSR